MLIRNGISFKNVEYAIPISVGAEGLNLKTVGKNVGEEFFILRTTWKRRGLCEVKNGFESRKIFKTCCYEQVLCRM